MNYQQTLDYLFTKLPMFSRIGSAAFKKDLTNTIELCNFLGNPQTKIKCIHVAGTNGKGSVSHMLAAVLQSAGYKTGLYTSPHLKDFRERIKIDGEMISESFVIDFTERTRLIAEKIEPSFFELTVAMAFDYFEKEKVDVAVIEVGLGGRYDSTNIITPELSVITNIGLDHTNILGDTLELIAAEKAGIIKPGIPVVIGEHHPSTAPVFQSKATKENAPISFSKDVFLITDWKYNKHLLEAEVMKTHTDEKHFYTLDLPGVYQTKNLAAVLASIHILQNKGWRIPADAIGNGLRHTKKLTGLHGRWDVIQEHPTVVLDVGHNADGMKAILSQLELTTYHQLHIVIGVVKDKDVDAVLSLLPVTAHYYFTRAQIPRALNEDILKEKGKRFGLQGHHYPTVAKALDAAKLAAHKDDLILICGSVFVVGEV